MIGRMKNKLLKTSKKSKVTDEIIDDRSSTPSPPPLSQSSKDETTTSTSSSSSDMQLSRSSDDIIDSAHDRIGKYVIVALLGEAQATVYLAENILRGGKKHRVVLKKQPLISPRGHRFITRARIEKMIMQELNSEIYKSHEGSKYIVRMIEEIYSVRLNEHYIVMEYCECGALIDHLNDMDGIPYDLDITRRLIMDILQAVSLLHTLGIAHRDIKIDNIMLQHNGQRIICKLGDFGMSMFMQPGMQDNSTLGSPREAAPDLVKTIFEHSETFEKDPFAVDIWALGVVVYTMIELAFPYESDPPETPFEFSMRVGQEKTGQMTRMELDSIYHKIFINARRPREKFLDDITLNNFINMMLEYNYKERATIDALVQHAFMKQGMRSLKMFDFSVTRGRH